MEIRGRVKGAAGRVLMLRVGRVAFRCWVREDGGPFLWMAKGDRHVVNYEPVPFWSLNR
jgi:hypothetical protein